jgi:quinoprotein dehydrogenase-associated probable ABC transporter substrate-binding protein
MYSRCLSVLGLLALSAAAATGSELRVCADPNNMPFSNQQEQGLENKLAGLIAAKLGARLEYIWWSQRKSFVKNSLDEGRCDVLMGVPATLDSVTTTKPYYRSTYVFVSRRDRNLKAGSLADPRLTNWRIGIHVVGDDYAPPAYALARRGITANVVPFSLFGEYGEANPPARIIEAVESEQIDVAIVWGPFAGYFAKSSTVPLDVVPVTPPVFLGIPFTYDISLGVRKGNEALKAMLDGVLDTESADVQQILSEYGLPQVH